MKKHFGKISLLLLAAAFFVTGCGPTPKDPKTASKQHIRVNIGDEPQALDPRKARDLSAITLIRMLFEGLTRVNGEEKADLAIAKRVNVSDDLKTYTFFLKEAKWSNGDPVTAEDFAYAWKKILDPHFPADNAFQLYVIKNAKAAKENKVTFDQVGVRVLDRLILQVELENPTPYFLELTAFPAFFPINHKVDEKNPRWAENASTYVSNGPFTLVQWKHNDIITVKKNASYWDAKAVKLQEIDLPMITEGTELKMYEKNELDWAGSPLSVLPVDALKSLKKEKQLFTKPLLGTYFFRTNTERPPFNNPSMRKAFALAINRQAIVDHVTQGKQIPATGLVPSSMGLQKVPYFSDGDRHTAKEYFQAALNETNFSKEELSNITLTYAAGERNHLIAQAVQQQWFETLGIRVKLEAVEKKVYYDRLSKQDYQMASGSWIADFNDPINFLEVFKYKKASTNNTLWENQEYTKLLDLSSTTKDAKARLEILAQSEKILMESMPIIPVFYYTMLYVKSPKVKGEVLSSMGNLDFKWAEVETLENPLGDKK